MEEQNTQIGLVTEIANRHGLSILRFEWNCFIYSNTKLLLLRTARRSSRRHSGSRNVTGQLYGASKLALIPLVSLVSPYRRLW